MRVSNATMRGLQGTRLFIRKNVERFLQATQEEKDTILKTMEKIETEGLIFEVSGSLLLHPYLRDCNLDVERFVEALTLTPMGRNFEAGVVELADVAEALRKGRMKLDRINAEIQYKKTELRVINKTIAELKPQVMSNTAELDMNAIHEVDEDVPEVVAKFSTATEEMLGDAIMHGTERMRGILTYIGRELMDMDLPMEQTPTFLNGYAAAEEYCA